MLCLCGLVDEPVVRPQQKWNLRREQQAAVTDEESKCFRTCGFRESPLTYTV